MRLLLTAFACALGFVAPARAMDENLTFHMVQGEIDGAEIDGEDVVSWDGDAWIGGDINKFRIKTEGQIEDGDVHEAEIQALWSRNVAEFWDIQAGVRVDLEPDATTHLAFGVQGLAPYQFETEATAFLSEDGDLSARLHQSLDFHFTQRLIAEPHIEVNAYAQEIAEQNIGAGFSDVEVGVQLRYEFTRKFAPYLDVVWSRALGETASLRRADGEDVETSSVRAGLRFWF